ncbi:hypothetical protein F4859DRAFT_520244 [Xylaria cf. heliscus]|nr:hypothetical protein F4859DRAFT_520244 [Xylaria cf. heliscus]
MGGRVWTKAEERYFWHVVVIQSPKRVGTDLENEEKSWDQLATEMQDAMGDKARREYTGTMLFEHFFQNSERKITSPNGCAYVQEYLMKRYRYYESLANYHNSFDTSSTPSEPRISEYIRFVTEPDATSYSQIHPQQSAPNEDSSSIPFGFGSLADSNTAFYGSYGIPDSTGASTNTFTDVYSYGADASALEEGEVPEYRSDISQDMGTADPEYEIWRNMDT